MGIIKEGKIIEIADIKTLQRNNYKKVQVVADSFAEGCFDIPGVTHLEHANGVMRFFYKGDINAVLH